MTKRLAPKRQTVITACMTALNGGIGGIVTNPRNSGAVERTLGASIKIKGTTVTPNRIIGNSFNVFMALSALRSNDS